MLSLFHVQIIVEGVFFGAILFLLWRLKRDIEKYRPLADGSIMDPLKKIMADSQEAANGFVTQMEENKHALNKLARQLDEKEQGLATILKEAASVIKRFDSEQSKSGSTSSTKRYDDVMDMVQQGMTREEVSKHSDLTEGEINLIMELSRARTRQPS